MKAVLRFGRGVVILALVVSLTTALGSGKPVTASQTLLASDLRISQVYGGGGNTSAPYTNDFIEIFNAGAASVSLNGLSVQYASATGTGSFGATDTQMTLLPDVMLGPGQYYLIQEAGGTNGSPLPTPDLTDATPINLSGTSGKVIIANTTTSLGCNGGSTPCSPEQLALIIDLVGYGTANFYEGAAAAPTLSNTTAAFRASNGCTDTDNNSADFTADTPAPRNSASPTHSCTASQAAIVLTKTVGTDPLACATTEEVSLPFGGGEVTYCYSVENTGDVALVLHDLEDSELGTILNNFPYTLAPNASTFITQTAMVTMTTVNSALWTAFNAGPTDVVTATDVATVTVALPAPAIVLTKTVGTDPLACATTEEVSLPFGGGEVTYCYSVENTGDVALVLHDLEDSELGTILNNFPYTLAPNASIFITQTAMVTMTTVNSALWTAFNAGPTDVVTATDVATVTVALPVPAIVLTKTVGTTPGVCATTDDISVAEGTTVYYCYQVENTGNVPFDYHDLVDTQLGTILDGSAYVLAPGALHPPVIVSATLSATTVNTATWTAYTTVGGPATSATDTARVVVTPSAVSVTELQASAAGGWSSVALLGALALGGVAWRRRRR